MSDTVSLDGLRVLVLEDEALLSMMLEDTLVDLGCRVVGPFLHMEEAMDELRRSRADIDFGILDVNIAGQRSFPLAQAMTEAGVPFVFVTGYDEQGVDEPWRAWPAVRKPFSGAELRHALSRAVSAGPLPPPGR